MDSDFENFTKNGLNQTTIPMLVLVFVMAIAIFYTYELRLPKFGKDDFPGFATACKREREREFYVVYLVDTDDLIVIPMDWLRDNDIYHERFIITV